MAIIVDGQAITVASEFSGCVLTNVVGLGNSGSDSWSGTTTDGTYGGNGQVSSEDPAQPVVWSTSSEYRPVIDQSSSGASWIQDAGTSDWQTNGGTPTKFVVPAGVSIIEAKASIAGNVFPEVEAGDHATTGNIWLLKNNPLTYEQSIGSGDILDLQLMELKGTPEQLDMSYYPSELLPSPTLVAASKFSQWGGTQSFFNWCTTYLDSGPIGCQAGDIFEFWYFVSVAEPSTATTIINWWFSSGPINLAAPYDNRVSIQAIG